MELTENEKLAQEIRQLRTELQKLNRRESRRPGGVDGGFTAPANIFHGMPEMIGAVDIENYGL